MDDMALAHRKDYAAKRLIDDARVALRAVLACDDCRRKIGETVSDEVADVAGALDLQASQIVQRWD